MGRIGNLKINLIRECLEDADSFTLATEGMTRFHFAAIGRDSTWSTVSPYKLD